MEALQLGFLTVYPFGLCTAAGAVAMVLWACCRTKDPEERRTLEWFALFAVPLGLLFSHLAYCLCDLDWISDYFWETLADFPGGGYLLYGAMIGMGTAMWIACRMTGKSPAVPADMLAAPFLLFTAVLTAGEGLIGAGYGWKVEDWFQAESGMSFFTLEDVSFFSRFPFAMKDSYYGYASWAVFLPVAAGLALCTLFAARCGIRRDNRAGGTAVLAGELYACIRILYESLRQDDILKWGFVRVNQILSAVLLMTLLLLSFLLLRKRDAAAARTGKLLSSLGIFLAGVIVTGAMEFALEKKIGFLEWMPMDLCYVFSAIGCILLFISCDRLRREAFGCGKGKDAQ